jgi:transcription antitermination factor NusG
VVLFPGYLFFCGDEPDRLSLLSTGRVVRLIPVEDRQRFVCEIAAIQRMLSQDLPVGPVDQLKKGTPCRIVDGPLAGLEGTVEQRQGRRRFVVMVSMLGQGAAVEVDAKSLEPLDR